MDINLSYNCLLRRLWIHMAGAVPLTLHQNVKFVTKDNLITVVAEEDMVATTTIFTPYVEVEEDTTKCSFKSFEVVIAICTKDGLEMSTPHLS